MLRANNRGKPPGYECRPATQKPTESASHTIARARQLEEIENIATALMCEDCEKVTT